MKEISIIIKIIKIIMIIKIIKITKIIKMIKITKIIKMIKIRRRKFTSMAVEVSDVSDSPPAL